MNHVDLRFFNLEFPHKKLHYCLEVSLPHALDSGAQDITDARHENKVTYRDWYYTFFFFFF